MAIITGTTDNDAIRGTDVSDTIAGLAGNDTLLGGLGDDVLTGDEGDDYLDGGAESDKLTGGAGNDTYVVDNSGDDVVEGKDGGIDTAESRVDYTLAENVENLILRGTDSISGTGNALDNVITGNDGGNLLWGAGGSDTLAGGAGDDTYVLGIGDAADKVVEGADGGTDTVHSDLAAYTLTSNVENLVLEDNGGDGTGNTLDNEITGNESANRLDGGAGNDIIRGFGGDDILLGGAGDDRLLGGIGNDRLEGGAGNDSYDIGNEEDQVVELANQGTDTVRALSSFDLSTHGDNVENLVLLDDAMGSALNATGNNLDNILTGNRIENVLRGGDGDDVLLGNGGDDELHGDAGNDLLDGGEDDGQHNHESLAGGSGNDLYIVHAGTTVEIIEAANGGTDSVQSEDSNIDISNFDNVENITLLDSGGQDPFASNDINAKGNNLANIITGNVAENTLEGGGGNDTLIGGLGGDTYLLHAGDESDKVVETANGGYDTVISTMTDYTLAANVETLTLSFKTGAISGTGNALGNTIVGNEQDNLLDGAGGNDLIFGFDGNDDLSGGAGDDTLDGGNGKDTLDGGAGDDAYFVNDALDIVVEKAGGGTDTIFAGLSFDMSLRGANVEKLNVNGSGNINVIGNDLDNTIVGGGGANKLEGGKGDDILDGGAGNDKLVGGLGNDTFYVDSTDDEVVEAKDGGVDLVKSSATYILAFGEELEGLTLTGKGNIDGTGNELNNTITGNEGSNTLTGGAGDDTLAGGLGNDTYVVMLNDGKDKVVEAVNAGIDTVDSALATYTLGANVENLVLNTNGGNIDGIGNALDNFIQGNSSNNKIFGMAGNDALDGGLGNDALDGGNGRDQIFGAAGNDSLSGGADDDHIEGGGDDDILLGDAGDDVLIGGTGSDTLKGGAGDDLYFVEDANDTILENKGEGIDHIDAISVSFDLSKNGQNVEILSLSGTGKTNGFGNDIDNIITGNFDDNILTGAAGDDKLSGDAGNDLLDGGTGDDIIHGDAGNDFVAGADGNDVLDGGIGDDTMTGGFGNDTYFVDSTLDTITEAVGQGIDLVHSLVSVNLQNFGEVENVVLDGSANLNATGNSFANIVTGNAGKNMLSGGAGNDTLIGGDGNDTYTLSADDANDKIVEGIGKAGDRDTVISFLANYKLATNAEILQLGGTAAINGTGNALDNQIDGNTAANKIDGDAGNDQLHGGAGNDILIGGAGFDFLDGGEGADEMSGGAGGDGYIVDNVGDKIIELAGGGTDTIVSNLATFDLSSNGKNVENLTSNVSVNFTGIGNELNNIIGGASGTDTLSGNSGDDLLDGAGGNDTLYGGDTDGKLLADGNDILNGGSGNDVLFGGSGNDKLRGDSGNDQLFGGAGNDELTGGDGADKMSGGAGNDFYIVNDGKDEAIEDTDQPSGGVDLVQSSVSYLLGKGIENLTLTGEAEAGTGNELANIITGTAGDNVLTGGGGNDTLIGGLGDDVYNIDIGDGSDKIVEASDGGHDTVQSFLESYTLAANAEDLTLAFGGGITGIGNALDNFILGNGLANNLQGMSGNDRLEGGDGNDVLDGGAGNDELTGGQGADELRGGAGDDRYIVGDNLDTIIEAAGGGRDIVFSTVSYTLGANVEDLILAGDSGDKLVGMGNAADNSIGSFGDEDDHLFGLAGNDTMAGGAGNDILEGGVGNDIYFVGAGDEDDKIVEKAGEGVDAIFTIINYSLTDDQEIENLTLVGEDDIVGIGNSLNNVITGNEGDNGFFGGDGIDTLIGGAGNDTYILGRDGAEDAQDKIIESANGGRDRVISNFHDYTLGANLEDLLLDSPNASLTAAVPTAVNGTGNALDNIIEGNEIANTLKGLAGNDTLDGHGGGDILEGGAGNDTYIVWEMVDQVKEAAGGGTDQVRTDLANYVLADNVENLILTAIDAGQHATGNVLGNDISGTQQDDTIDGGAGNDYLRGGGGSDVLTGGAGDDTLDAGDLGSDSSSGSDALVGGIGNDTYIVHPGGADGLIVTELANGGIDLIKSDWDFSLADTANVENLTLLGSRDSEGFGNGLANVITGNAGDNFLAGGGGNDTLIGGAGDDLYLIDVGDAGDKVVEAAGGGHDAVLSHLHDYTLGANLEDLFLTAAALLTAGGGEGGVNGTGNTLDNRIAGNGLDNRLDGAAGNDVLDGGAGNDTLIGGAGNDILIGGAGKDSMTGGAGDDVFRFKAHDAGEIPLLAGDIITDFQKGHDQIDVADLLTAIGNREPTKAFEDGFIQLTQDDAGNTLVRFDADGSAGSGDAVILVKVVGVHLMEADVIL